MLSGRSRGRVRAAAAGGWAQVALFAGAYASYRLAYGLTTGDPGVARAHGQQLLDLERTLGLGFERPVQEALGPLLGGLTVIYLLAQLVIVWLVLAWCWRHGRPAYTRLRDCLLATWVTGIVCFAAWPAAPPRFLPASGLTDQLHAQLGSATKGATAIYNPYAAMPSLHCAFALLAGLAVMGCVRGRLRYLALLWPAAVALATVATGNHWVIDVLAGQALAAAAWGVQPALRRARARRPVPARAAELGTSPAA